jgi:hypothetical protein
MNRTRKRPTGTGRTAQKGRHRVLKKALLAAAYATPVVQSYPSTVFATHVCGKKHRKAGRENCMGQLFTPGCSPV